MNFITHNTVPKSISYLIRKSSLIFLKNFSQFRNSFHRRIMEQIVGTKLCLDNATTFVVEMSQNNEMLTILLKICLAWKSNSDLSARNRNDNGYTNCAVLLFIKSPLK